MIGYRCDPVLGNVDRREQPNAVAHRDLMLILRVVRLDVFKALGHSSLGGATTTKEQRDNDDRGFQLASCMTGFLLEASSSILARR